MSRFRPVPLSLRTPYGRRAVERLRRTPQPETYELRQALGAVQDEPGAFCAVRAECFDVGLVRGAGGVLWVAQGLPTSGHARRIAETVAERTGLALEVEQPFAQPAA
jgi:hypothetical protein